MEKKYLADSRQKTRESGEDKTEKQKWKCSKRLYGLTDSRDQLQETLDEVFVWLLAAHHQFHNNIVDHFEAQQLPVK